MKSPDLRVNLLAFALVGLGFTLPTMLRAADHTVADQPWRDTALTPENRASSLLAAMTLDQKVSLVSAVDPAEYSSLAALGIPAMMRVDASCGLRGDRGVTAFPVPIALAATFDLDLAGRVGSAIAQEARGKGWNEVLGPTVDVARDPRSGRLAEGYGEDPHLSASMGVAVAKGMESQHVLVMPKHFTAYQTERDRTRMNEVVSPRALREVYNVPFDALVSQANVGALMASYPKINGTFAMENKSVIDMIKVDDGFRGFVATDFMGGADGVAQINAGIDSWALQPFLRRPQALKDGHVPAARLDDAVTRNLWALFSSGVFDHAVSPTPLAVVTSPAHQALAVREATEATVLLKNDGGLLPLYRKGRIAVIGPADRDIVTGVMWSSWVEPGAFVAPLDAIAKAAGPNVEVVQARGSVGDIPLPPMALSEGDPFAPRVALETSDGSKGWALEVFGSTEFSGTPTHRLNTKSVDISSKPFDDLPDHWSARWTTRLTPQTDGLVRISALLSGTVRVSVDGHPVIDGRRSTASNFPGGGSLTYPLQGTVQLHGGKPINVSVEYSTDGAVIGQRLLLGWEPFSRIAEAVESARHADVAVVFVNQVTGEEMDRDNLMLPGDQDALIEAVSAANPNTVVVLNTGGPVKMPWLAKVRSVLQMWYPGSAGGQGIADVLFGDAEPGGRLPVTFPADESQGPSHYAGGLTQDFSEGVFVGHSWFEKEKQAPLFPFGFGLSYTTFAVGGLSAKDLVGNEQGTSVDVNVTNTGKRKGSTVVQVYGGPLHSQEPTADRLLGFDRVELRPGETKAVRLKIDRRSLSQWSESAHQWVTPKGDVSIRVGQSATDVGARGILVVH